MAADTWLGRILAVPCPEGCAGRGDSCDWAGKPAAGRVCASRIQAAEASEALERAELVDDHGLFVRLPDSEVERQMFACWHRTCPANAAHVCNLHPYDGGAWCGRAYCDEHLPGGPDICKGRTP